MVAIFSYGLDESKENFKKAKCPLVTLAHYDTMLTKAVKTNYINQSEAKLLRDWKKDPKNWMK